MELIKDVEKNISDFVKLFDLQKVSSVNNGSNLQMIFKNKEIKIEFVRDKGEFDIYLGLLNIETKRDIYSIVILAKILSEKDFSDSSSKTIIDYLTLNLDEIKSCFLKQQSMIESKYETAFIDSFW